MLQTGHSKEWFSEPFFSLKTVHSYEWFSKTSLSIPVSWGLLPRQFKNWTFQRTVLRTGLITKKTFFSLKNRSYLWMVLQTIDSFHDKVIDKMLLNRGPVSRSFIRSERPSASGSIVFSEQPSVLCTVVKRPLANQEHLGQRLRMTSYLQDSWLIHICTAISSHKKYGY
jgi:hypothetical protein